MSTDTCDGCGRTVQAEGMHPVGHAAFCSKCWRALVRQIVQQFIDDVGRLGLATVRQKYRAITGWNLFRVVSEIDGGD